MKRLTVLAIISLFNLSYGQQLPTDTKLVSLTKADFGFQGIGLTYEPRISKKYDNRFICRSWRRL
jgi:hypothetical protein